MEEQVTKNAVPGPYIRGGAVHLLRPSLRFPRRASCTFVPSRDLGVKVGSSYRLLSPSSRADRFGGPSSDRAAHTPARRLGIARWQTHCWTKPLTKVGTLLSSPAGRAKLFTRFCLFLFPFMVSATAPAATTNVTYASFSFTPKTVQIKVGDTVSWVGSGFHTLLGTGADPICGGAQLPCGHTFNTPGTYTYQCTVAGHAAAGMTGVVIVASVPVPPTPALLTNLTRLTNGQFRFTVITTANHTNIIQGSTNVARATNWVSLSTNFPTTNTFVFTDTNNAGLRLRFYRVVEPP